eukprot:403331263
MSSSIFECSICYNGYNESTHRPLITQCGHVYCEGCLTRCTTCPQLQTQNQPSDSSITHTQISTVLQQNTNILVNQPSQEVNSNQEMINNQNNSEGSESMIDSVPKEIRKYDENLTYFIKCPACQQIHQTHPSKLPCVYSIIAFLPQNNQVPAQTSGSSQPSETQRIKEQSSSILQSSQIRDKSQQKDQSNLIGISKSGNPAKQSQNLNQVSQIPAGYQNQPHPANCLRHPDKKIKFICESDMAFLCSRTIEQKKKEFTRIIREFYSDQKSKLDYDRMKTQKFLQKLSTHQKDFADIEQSLDTTSYEEFFKLMNEKNSEMNSMNEQVASLIRNMQSNEKSLTLAIFVDQVKISDFGNIQYVKALEYKTKSSSKRAQQEDREKLDNLIGGGKSPREISKNHNHRERTHSQSKKRQNATNLVQAKSQVSTQLTSQNPSLNQQQIILDKFQEEQNLKKTERAKQWQLDAKVEKKLHNIINKIHDVVPATSQLQYQPIIQSQSNPQTQMQLPVTVKNSSNKDLLDFKSNAENYDVKHLQQKQQQQNIFEMQYDNLPSSRGVASSNEMVQQYGSKNLSSTMTNKNPYVDQDKSVSQNIRGVSQHTPHTQISGNLVPLTHQHKSDNDVIPSNHTQNSNNSNLQKNTMYHNHQQQPTLQSHQSHQQIHIKPKMGAMINEYEKNLFTNQQQTTRRQTFVPSLRTELVSASNKNSHKTHFIDKNSDDHSSIIGQANVTTNAIIKSQNTNTKNQNNYTQINPYQSSGMIGSITQRGDGRYDRYANLNQNNDNDYEYSTTGAGGTAEKDYNKRGVVDRINIQGSGQQQQVQQHLFKEFKEDNLTYSKYLNPIKSSHTNTNAQNSQNQRDINQNLNLLQQSLDKPTNESIATNPFENGLLMMRQSTNPLNSINMNDTAPQIEQSSIMQDLESLKTISSKQNSNGGLMKGGGGHLSSDDEMILTNMIHEIQSKSQERKHHSNHNHQNKIKNVQSHANGVRVRLDSQIQQVNQNAQVESSQNLQIDNHHKLIKYTSNHLTNHNQDSAIASNPNIIGVRKQSSGVSSTAAYQPHSQQQQQQEVINSKKTKKEHSSKTHSNHQKDGHTKPNRRAVNHNDRYENSHQTSTSQQPAHKRNGSTQNQVQSSEMYTDIKQSGVNNNGGGMLTRRGDQTHFNQAALIQQEYSNNEFQKSAIQHSTNNTVSTANLNLNNKYL